MLLSRMMTTLAVVPAVLCRPDPVRGQDPVTEKPVSYRELCAKPYDLVSPGGGQLKTSFELSLWASLRWTTNHPGVAAIT